MDKLGSLAKGGWHPEKTGSVRGDIKSWVGRGDGGMAKARERAESHQTTPLSSLQDPASFAPPPKRVPTLEGDAISPSTVRTGSLSSGSGRPVPGPPRPGGSQAQQQESDDRPLPGPFRVDTTGLSTSNLPPPPVRRPGSPVTGSPSRSPVRTTATTNIGSGIVKKPGPALPPRLPPRSAVARSSNTVPATPPPPYSVATSKASTITAGANAGLLDQGALNRLGSSGVSVPGLGIGASIAESTNPQQDQEITRANVSELQSRFATLGSAATARAAEGNSPVTGKKPAIPPKKNVNLPSLSSASNPTQQDQTVPPPVPFSSKPR